MQTLDRKLMRDVWSLKTEILAIALVVAAGLATFVMSSGMIQSLEQSRQAFYDRYRFADVFAQVKRAPESLIQEISRIDGVRQVAGRVRLGAILNIPGLIEPANGQVISIPEGRQPALNALHLREGRLIDPQNVDEAIISEPFAQAHGLHPGDSLMVTLNGHRRSLNIVGIALSPEFIFALPPGGLFPDDRRFVIIWMGRRALEAAHDMDGAFNDLVIAVRPEANKEDVIDAVDRLTRPFGGRGAYSREDHISDFYVRNEMDQLAAMAFVAPLIFLAVAAFLINTVLSRMAELEREQIGTLRALGVSAAAIGTHYMKFALVVAGIGAAIGIGGGIRLGYGLTEMYVAFFRFPALNFTVPTSTLATAILIATATTLSGTGWTILKIMRLPPAQAMRPEPPPIYHRTLLERVGIERLFSPLSRMIYRHLERRGRRSLLACIGIGASLGVLISASFSLDAIDFIIDVQFTQAQREDITLSLIEPSEHAAFFDITSLPGVLRAEPFRTVPVKLHAAHRTERASLEGISKDARLHRTLDRTLNPVRMAPEGVMLSTKLADLLRVTSGDTLRVEVLEGKQPTRTLRVSGVVEQFIGTSALMDIHALNALMQEGDVISGAWLMLDKSKRAAFFKAASAAPVISGVTIQAAAIDSFNDTMAENLIRMTLFNIAFAGIIAFGVVYNTARISVAERARELASMRILGFTRGEISSVMLGELAILTLLAIPVGWLFGYGLAVLIVTSLETELFRIPLVIEPSTYAWATLVVLGASVLSALAVRRRLDRLDLVSVLKSRE